MHVPSDARSAQAITARSSPSSTHNRVVSHRWSVGLCTAAVLVAALAGMPLRAQQPPTVPDVLVSRQLAEAYDLSLDDVVLFSNDSSGANAREFRIRAIYEPTPNPMELTDAKFKARLHLPDLLALTADGDDPLAAEAVDGLNILLTDPSDAWAFSRDLMATVPGVLARPIAWMGNASVFVVLERFHLAIALVTIFASTVFLLALSVMLVDERRETVGVLRLIGLTTKRVLAQVFFEGLAIALVGALFGLALALASERVINAYFQWHYDTPLIFVRVTPTVAIQCLLIAVPLGVVASVSASWVLLRRQVMALARR